MKRKIQKAIFDFYKDIAYSTYTREKKRLQVELLSLQKWIVEEKQRVALVFEGRDAAGKGSTIKRFVENLMPKYLRVVELGTPTPAESKRWFQRYAKHMPSPGELVFFDRSWYNRAIIEPTMGYCKKSQYKYFMNKVLDWEEDLIRDGVVLIKFYLSVDKATQLYRFEERITDPLKYWKYSKNDQMVRSKWHIFTRYKEQMFERTSSALSPWVMVNSNNKLFARLTCMLYTVTHIDYGRKKPFVPLREEDVRQRYSITVDGVPFNGLNYRQYNVLRQLAKEQD